MVEKEQVKRQLNVTILERQEIEHSIQQQSRSQLWHQVRARRITGSKCVRIFCMKHYKENLLKSILYLHPMIFVPKPIEWGRDNEESAKMAYVRHMKKKGHTNLVVESCGFIVHLNQG